MIGLDQRGPRALNPVLAAAYGALLALIIGYTGSYALTHYGAGIVGGRGDRVVGPVAFARSGLNLYALQHVSLDGVGSVVDSLGVRRKLTAAISLPLTVWAIVPVAALMIGGYCAARSRALRGRLAMTGAAVAAGVAYAIVLSAASRFVEARLDTFLMPELGGFSANPPQIDFHPYARSSVIFGLGFGISFGYLGALIAVRGATRESTPGRWWACGKAVVVTGLAIQVLIACAAFGIAVTRKGADVDSNPRIVEMLPTAAGIGYAMIHGATLISSVESRIVSREGIHRAFYAEASAYWGVKQEHSEKPSSPSIWVTALAVGVIASVVCGALAVRWGSRDGSLPTAWRTAILHTAYLALLPVLCEMSLRQADAISSSTIQVRAHWSAVLALSFAGVLVCSLIGAHLANRRRLGTPIA